MNNNRETEINKEERHSNQTEQSTEMKYNQQIAEVDESSYMEKSRVYGIRVVGNHI